MPCISIPTATLIAGGLGAAGAVGSAVIGSNAAKDAAKTQSQAADKAAGILQPYVTAGKGGITGVQNLLGINADAPGGMDMEAVNSALAQTPGYQFALKQGLQATQNGYAAKGLASSGAALKGAADYSEGLAGTNYQNIFGNFMQLAQLGGNAAAGQGNLITGGASATAAGQIGSANSIISGISGATSAIDNSALMLALNNAGMFGAGGGGATNALGGSQGYSYRGPDPWAGAR